MAFKPYCAECRSWHTEQEGHMDPNCECRRPAGQCVKGDMDRCPAEDDEDDGSMECPACGGTTINVEGFNCEECDGWGRVSL